MNGLLNGGGVTVLFSQQPFTTELVTAWKKRFRYEWVRVKTLKAGFLNAKKMPLRQHEVICVFYDKLPTYNPQGLIQLDKPIHNKNCKSQNTNYHGHNAPYTTTHKNYPSDVLFFENRNHQSFHPTQKPVDLLEYLIRTYTNEGETVLDNCMGSGSTGVACVNTNRNFIGFELDEHYFEIAKKRIGEAQTALSNRGGIVMR